jgi:hypothetical protein
MQVQNLFKKNKLELHFKLFIGPHQIVDWPKSLRFLETKEKFSPSNFNSMTFEHPSHPLESIRTNRLIFFHRHQLLNYSIIECHAQPVTKSALIFKLRHFGRTKKPNKAEIQQ